MKNNIVFTFFCATLILPVLCVSQDPRQYFNFGEEENEQPDDPYLPNAYNNKELSPPYYFDGHARSGNTMIFTRQVNVSESQQNIIGDAANEPNIAVNPLNENEIVIGWRQFDNVNSNFRQAGWAYSINGGHTWAFPGSIRPGVFQSDPVLDYDSDGTFYYNSLASTALGGFPCYVYKSDNGGKNWNNGVYIGGGDKQWMAIDRSGGIGEGNIYSAWSPLFNDCPPGFFTLSVDGAESFEECSVIPEELAWGTLTVGNQGELYVCGSSPTSAAVRVAKSTDAQDPIHSPTWTLTTANLGGFITAGTPINPEGLTGQIYIDVDRSHGPGRDNVYVLGSVQPYFNSDPADIMFQKSTDGGMTWNNANPVRINDDSDTTNIQWFGTMAVAPNGRIDVVWLDTRDTPGSDSSALYYSYSIDQGTTWSVNEKLSDSFNPHIGYPNQQKMGDYIDMVSVNNGAHVAWVNTFNGSEDVYYSFITPPEMTASHDVSGTFDFSVYPNPTNDQLIISSGNQEVSVEIFTAAGKNVFLDLAFNTRHVIDISALTAGIYLVKLVSKDKAEMITKIVRG